jgi:PAS domain S-box-containing protein
MEIDLPEKQATILLVDDTVDNLMLLTEILKDEYRIRVANSGEKALLIAQSNNPPDLILLDIMMPGIDGHEVCRQLKSNSKTERIPIIFVSALSEVQDESFGFDLGAVDYIIKPVRPKLVKARVKAHLSISQQEHLIDASRRKFQRLVDDVGDRFVVFSYNPIDLKITYISDGVKTVFGLEKSEILYQDWLSCIPWRPKDLEQLKLNNEQLKNQYLNSSDAEHHFLHPDGTYHIVTVTKHTVFNSEGNLIAIEGIIEDITERKLFETQLQQQANQERLLTTITQRIRSSLNLEEILETTVQETHCILNADRVLVYKVFTNGTGAVIAESVSPEWPKLLDRVFPEEVFPQVNYDRYVQGRIFVLEDAVQQKDRILPCLIDFLKEIQVQAKLVVPIIQDKTLWGLLIAHQCRCSRFWQDWEINLFHRICDQLSIAIQQAHLFDQLEERNQKLAIFNEELLQATRLKDDFLANMSHELRTPLNAILGMAEGIQDGIFGEVNDGQKNALKTIERSGHHLLELINDILDLAKVESGKMELDRTPVGCIPVMHKYKYALPVQLQ